MVYESCFQDRSRIWFEYLNIGIVQPLVEGTQTHCAIFQVEASGIQEAQVSRIIELHFEFHLRGDKAFKFLD